MTAPLLTVDPDSSRPPFEQVRAQLADAIASGALGAEERLPPIRQVAADLGLAVNTVARAYRELESAGLVETRGRNGTFVVGSPTDSRRQAMERTRAHIDGMRALGISPTEMLAMLRREIETGA
jgi:DNA-binding transcriptional regulator YhcF (GntR family)